MNASHLEPADRDPKAIRRTVFFLVSLILVGGFAILYKYQKQQESDRLEVIEGRSPRIGRLTKNFAGVCQDGESRGLNDLEGKVWAVSAIVPNFPEENKIQLAKMQELAERYKGRDDFHLVCLSVADPTDKSQNAGHERLKEIADEVGADIDQWWFMAAEEEKVIGFLKDHLKMAHIKERSGEEAVKRGKHDIAAQIRIIDQSRRVRGEHQQFDFDLARNRMEQEKRYLAENPHKLENADVKDAAKFYLNMDEEWTKRMHKVIDYTFTETEQDSDPDYITALMVTFGVVGFIVVQVVRIRRRKNA